MKYLGINLPKEVKDLYSGNYKTLMRKINTGILVFSFYLKAHFLRFSSPLRNRN